MQDDVWDAELQKNARREIKTMPQFQTRDQNSLNDLLFYPSTTSSW
jgi:hypothetical protein